MTEVQAKALAQQINEEKDNILAQPERINPNVWRIRATRNAGTSNQITITASDEREWQSIQAMWAELEVRSS